MDLEKIGKGKDEHEIIESISSAFNSGVIGLFKMAINKAPHIESIKRVHSLLCIVLYEIPMAGLVRCHKYMIRHTNEIIDHDDKFFDKNGLLKLIKPDQDEFMVVDIVLSAYELMKIVSEDEKNEIWDRLFAVCVACHKFKEHVELTGNVY